MKKYIILALALVAMAGCAKDETLGGGSGDGDNAVKFSSDQLFSSSVSSKLTDDGSEWTSGDQVGIFMMNSSPSGFAYSNVPYTANSSASKTSFTAVSEQIAYPSNGESFTFYAYYPYSASATYDKISVDVSNQENPGDIALMISDNNPVWNSYSDNVDKEITFSFEHKTAMIKFNLKPEASEVDKFSTLSKVAIKMPTTADYDVFGTQSNVGSELIVDMKKNTQSSTEADYSALIIPADSVSYPVYIVGGDNTYTLTLSGDFDEAYIYEYTISVGNKVVSFEGESTITPMEPGSLTDSNLTTDKYEGTPISTVEQFNAMSLDGDYVLVNDLDFEGATITPLGDAQSHFTGSLNGAGYTIKNYKVDMLSYCQGVFGYVGKNGVVKNLNVECDMFMSETSSASTINYFGTVASN